jgi:UDP-N-acetylmuramyl tripeptide synthase
MAQQLPRRRSWVRRHKFLVVCVAVAAVLIVGGAVRTIASVSTPADYRDPVQLAQAMKAAEHGAAASCGKLPGGKYFCTVANTDGTSGNFTVTVAADGRSFQAS